jgi:hypothetical protein
MAVAHVLYVLEEDERGEVDAAEHLLDVDTLPELARHLSSLIDDMHAAGCEIARATSDGANHG